MSKIFLFVIAVSAFPISGCYTKLMTGEEFVNVRRTSSKAKTLADNSFSLNYNQSCNTCHTVAELDERAEELQYYGIQSVHNGVLLASHSWRNGSSDGSILIAAPNPYWPGPLAPTYYPWWEPAVSSTTTTPSQQPVSRPRTGGSTRDGNSERERSQPTTYTQPQTPVGGAAPVSIPSSQPSTSTSAPASNPPAPSNDADRSRERSSDGGSSSTRTRSDGTSRDDGNRPR